MEASFQADKRQLRADKEECRKEADALRERLSRQQAELEEWRGKLVAEQQAWDKERGDHATAVRELQRLLAEERGARQALEAEVDELRVRTAQAESLCGQHEKRGQELRGEGEALRRRLRKAESRAGELPQLQLLRDEMAAGLKSQHEAAIRQEQERAIAAEERARKLAATHEERVANLESRLAELSETVGNYDRLRQQDQLAIHKLKDQLAQLGRSRGASEGDAKEGGSEVDRDRDVQQLVEKMLRLRAQLLSANQLADKPLRLDSVLGLKDLLPRDEGAEHAECREEERRLRQELESCRKQLLVAKHPAASSNKEAAVPAAGETSALKLQLKESKEQVSSLRAQLREAEQQLSHRTLQHQKVLKAEQARWREEQSRREAEARAKASSLEQQLQKQRERSLALLEEKEQEIRTLKESFHMFLPGRKASASSAGSRTPAEACTDDVVASLSQFGGTVRGGAGQSPHMLHYAHELARRDVEISNLRKSRLQLEGALRELQRSGAASQERHLEQVAALQEEVSRLQRCQSREGANLEYLKNVVLSFLLTGDPGARRHMLNAISAVLQFTSTEVERVNHNLALALLL
ncbi:GRIP and coiled-coil domain-containing protein 1 isoform X2 [Bacillus rossius redtenbacheri]